MRCGSDEREFATEKRGGVEKRGDGKKRASAQQLKRRSLREQEYGALQKGEGRRNSRVHSHRIAGRTSRMCCSLQRVTHSEPHAFTVAS